jgi:YfdX protein
MSAKHIPIGIAVLLLSLYGQSASDHRIELSTQAASLVRQAEIARQAVANHDPSVARDHVQQALALAAKLPEAAVPISSEFEGVSTLVPAKRRTSVSAVTGEYTATTLNVSAARGHLQAALAAIDKGDLEAAGADLAAMQSEVVTKTYSGEFPLVQARDNLAIARARATEAKYKDAILPLKSAARALDRWAHEAPRPKFADLAARLSIELEAYAERIGHDHDDAVDRISAWCDQVTDWFNSGLSL